MKLLRDLPSNENLRLRSRFDAFMIAVLAVTVFAVGVAWSIVILRKTCSWDHRQLEPAHLSRGVTS